ncbi:cuticle protein 14-like [Centruroides vittatus]|uniref:cuticle protein 14-like n=1 Tax=Centruroides sculpturatus TaxID=218467 RepID=UPI000C6DB3EC|nr:cuticle protein 14-like [Centruroides sculpturatus]
MGYELFVFFISAATTVSTVPWGYGREVPIPAGTRANYYIRDYDGPGTYKFGYDTGSGPNQSFRREERTSDGIIRGRYGHVDLSGVLHVVEYKADKTGYHVIRNRVMVPESKPKPAIRLRTRFVGPLPPFILG